MEKSQKRSAAKDKLEMMIGGWVEPLATDADYRLAKEMGLTHMFVGDGCYGLVRGTPEFAKLFDLCEKAGLKALVRTMYGPRCKDPAPDHTDYTKYPAVWAVNWWDEPFDEDLVRAAKLADFHMEKYGDRLVFFMNLNPPVQSEGWRPYGPEKTYADYVENYCELVLSKITKGKRILSCDIYPIHFKDNVRFLWEGWLGGIEKIAVSALKHDAEPHAFIQAASWAGFYPPLTEEDLRFQFLTYMTFGVRHFTYYTYTDYGVETDEEYHRALVSNKVSCEVHPLYYAAKKINSELKAVQEIYLSYKWKGMMPVIGSKNESGKNDNFDGLTSALGNISFCSAVRATQDALIGEFEKEGNGKAIAVVNFTDPAKNLSNTVNITFSEAKQVAVYSRGEKSVRTLEGGSLELNLGAGEGAFIVVEE